jgi:hypothetical protein
MEGELRRAGAPHRFVRYQDRGHMFITDEVIMESRAFINSFPGPIGPG